MTPTVISESTTEPILVGEAGENLRAADDGGTPPVYVETTRINRLIKAARQACENELEMSLVLKTLEVSQCSFYPSRIELPFGPVRSAVSVTYVDPDGIEQELAANQYRLTTSGRMTILWPAYNVTWPSVRSEADSVRIQYTAGYDHENSPVQDIPEPIRQAMHLYIAHWYTHREAVDDNSLMELPLGARHLLGAYRQGLGV